MRVFCLILIIFISPRVDAYDESWISLSTKKSFSDTNFVLADFVRRDTNVPFADYFRNLYRVAYGQKFESWQFLMGLVYADFAQTESEYRVFQQMIRGFRLNLFETRGFLRAGLEQRYFDGDEELHWRGRFKVLLEPYKESRLGLSFYNESFWGLTGGDRFKYGYNENRLALGLRAKVLNMETLLYWVHTDLIQVSGKAKDVEWFQFQVNFDLDNI